MAVPQPLPSLPAGLVEAYLNRLGIMEPPEPTRAGLAALQRAHLRRVPFENLDIHLGVPIALDALASARKVAEGGRGGFCYELNSAFGSLLAALGFVVELREARVFTPTGDEGMPFGHACLVIRSADGPLLVDVGFGRAFDEPLELVPGVEQADTAGSFVLRPAAGGALDLVQDGAPQNRIFPVARSLADFADGCVFHQTSPDSTFTRGTVATIRTAAGRTTLSGLQLIETAPAGREERAIDPGELRSVLAERFGIVLAEVEADRLAQVPAPPADARA